MKAPEKIYLTQLMLFAAPTISNSDKDVEYIHTDAFLTKAKGWFENHQEQYDANGVRCYSTEDFEDFLKAMKL